MAGESADDIELLNQLAPELRREIAAHLRWSRASRGRVMVMVGEETRDVFFLVSGEAHVLLYSPNGDEVRVQTIHAPAMFGEVAALDSGPRSASVIAASDVSLARMTQADFRRCLDESPAAALWLARHLTTIVRRLTGRVFELSALSVSERIWCELARLASERPAEGGTIRIAPAPTHAEIASRVGTHREAVTRELQMLAREKILSHGRRVIEVTDLSRLMDKAVSAGR